MVATAPVPGLRERKAAQTRLAIVASLRRRLADADLADMAYTLQVGREAMTLRLALRASSMEEVRGKLADQSQPDHRDALAQLDVDHVVLKMDDAARDGDLLQKPREEPGVQVIGVAHALVVVRVLQ